jgi:hypothetical protein
MESEDISGYYKALPALVVMMFVLPKRFNHSDPAGPVFFVDQTT